MKKVLITATVQSHIAQFHKPLIDILHKHGYEVHVAARDNLGEKNGLKLDSPDKIYNIPFDRSPFSKKNIDAYKQLKKIIAENRYDIIHCNTPMGGVLTRLAARVVRKKGVKVFYTAHGFHFYKGAPIINWLLYYPVEKYLARHTDKIITITEEDYLMASRKLNTKIFRIHGVGVDPLRYFPVSEEDKEMMRQDRGYSQKYFIILCTGELNKNKNQSTVIKAVAEVIKTNFDVKLLLAGNGPMEKELKELVKELGIDKNVEFLGYRTDLDKYVKISDIVVSASFREGLGLNIIEAMLCGKPVVSSINRGHKELVKEGKTGFLLFTKDILGFADRILTLKKDADLAKKMGELGEKSVELYVFDNVKRELELIYNFK
ncbi:glycosyltransferase family 4 protein [bacterium]|nr:glycosyltransferase family 4 protein [bacterium]